MEAVGLLRVISPGVVRRMRGADQPTSQATIRNMLPSTARRRKGKVRCGKPATAEARVRRRHRRLLVRRFAVKVLYKNCICHVMDVSSTTLIEGERGLLSARRRSSCSTQQMARLQMLSQLLSGQGGTAR